MRSMASGLSARFGLGRYKYRVKWILWRRCLSREKCLQGYTSISLGFSAVGYILACTR